MGRSYEQYCGLARALDVVGERWTLLIVRELLIRPARYGELAAALPGIASNLLADRLRGLVAAGVVERRGGGAGSVYALTPWGMQLRDVVGALVRWSAPLMRPGPGTDTFNPQWLLVALQALLGDRTSDRPVSVGLEIEDAALTVRLDEIGPHVEAAADPTLNTVLRAAPEVILGLAAGALSVEQAITRGELHGDPEQLATVFGDAGPSQPAGGD